MVEYVGRNRHSLICVTRNQTSGVSPAFLVSDRKQVSKYKSISFYQRPVSYVNGVRKYRGIVYERVKLAVFTAWIGSRGKGVQQPQVVFTTGERLCNPRWIHAGNLCFHTGRDQVAAQLSRGDLSYRKKRLKAAPL